MKRAVMIAVVACGRSTATPDARPDGVMADAQAPRRYVQVEQLARPLVAQVLLANDALLAAYNRTAPQPASPQIITEARATLASIYLGTCLVNGSLGLDARPAGVPCHAVGTALFDAEGALTLASRVAAQSYAGAVLTQLAPDVLRVDLGSSAGYFDPCGGGAPLWCGGRRLDDDVVDVTLDFLINGAATVKDTPLLSRLVSDGVAFSRVEANNRLNRTSVDPSNTAQGHAAVSHTVFPYAANPQ